MPEAHVDGRADRAGSNRQGVKEAHTSLLRLPPWRRVPSSSCASAILACASATASLFASSASSEALRLIMESLYPSASYPAVKSQVDLQAFRTNANGTVDQAAVPGVLQELTAQKDQVSELLAAMTHASLQPPELFAHNRHTIPSGSNLIDVNLLYGDRALQNVTILQKSDIEGFYIPKTVSTEVTAAVAGTNDSPARERRMISIRSGGRCDRFATVSLRTLPSSRQERRSRCVW